MRRVLGIDSETVTEPDGAARLVLVACSDGSTLEPTTHDYIRSGQALEYIVSRPGELWSFFGDYDCNFWLRDLPFSALNRLRETNHTFWHRWRIKHTPRRCFEVWDRDTSRYACVFDAWPFVQSSFVAWLEKWNLTDAATLDRIRRMKEQRAEFANLSRAEIKRYALDEVRLIAKGVTELKARVLSTGFRPSRWLGPGAVAARAMQANKVKQSMPDVSQPRWQRMANKIEAAYFGGRVETAIVGIRGATVASYDIASAYPAATVGLPCLRHGHWKQGVHSPYALAHVRWAFPAKSPWGPFPLRTPASLHYPVEGAGFYWYPEVEPWEHAPGLQIVRAWTWVPDCDCSPFGWVADLYEERARRKAAGDVSEYALKLVLNSIYGKTAQRVGARPYFCPMWAGLITATTRGRISRLLRLYGRRVLAVATDGVLAAGPLPIETDDNETPALGSWTLAGTYRGADFWQPGFYVLEGGATKTRGFRAAEVDTRAMRRAWRDGYLLGQVEIPRRKLVGYRLATHQNRMTDFCRWCDAPALVDFRPWPRRRPTKQHTQEGRSDYIQTLAPDALTPETRIVDVEGRIIAEYLRDGTPGGFEK